MLEVLARIHHRRIRRQLSPYLDGVLSARDSRRLEGHLAQCQACRDELAELRATVQALAELPLAEAPRSFALAAAPQPALRPAARRMEFGLRLATAAAAFALAAVLVGDFAGLPDTGDREERSMAGRAELYSAPAETEVAPQGPTAGPAESSADKQATTGTPSLLAPGIAGTGEEATPVPPATGGEGAAAPQLGAVAPSAGPETAAPGASQAAPPATTPTPAATPTPATTPTAAETPPGAFGLEGTPETAPPTLLPETPSPAATPPPVGAQIAPSGPEQQLSPEPEKQVPAEAERETLTAEEGGGPSRETVVRWLEVGLGIGLALLLVSWGLTRRRGRA